MNDTHDIIKREWHRVGGFPEDQTLAVAPEVCVNDLRYSKEQRQLIVDWLEFIKSLEGRTINAVTWDQVEGEFENVFSRLLVELEPVPPSKQGNGLGL